MFQFIANMFAWLGNYITGTYAYIGQLWGRLVQFTTVDMPDWFMAQVSELTAYLSTDPFTGLQDKLDMIDYIFPIYALLSIYLGALSITATIRLSRWIWELIMSVIP
jgi:hypothetical protein